MLLQIDPERFISAITNDFLFPLIDGIRDTIRSYPFRSAFVT